MAPAASSSTTTGPHRADHAPPYYTAPIVAHLVVPAMGLVERSAAPPQWRRLLLWLPLVLALVLALALLLLPQVRGAIIGLQWARHRHGFGTTDQGVYSHNPVLDLRRHCLGSAVKRT